MPTMRTMITALVCVAGAILMQPNLSSASLLALTGLTMVYLAGAQEEDSVIRNLVLHHDFVLQCQIAVCKANRNEH
jgi:cell division protein FtsW (lipid II flippase)